MRHPVRSRAVVYATLTLLITMIAAVAAADPPPVTDAPTIVVLGSSTAAGTGASTPDSSWVGRLHHHLLARDASVQIINLAIGGFTTYSIMPDGYQPPAGRPVPASGFNITGALAYHPRGIIINLPSNDVGLGFTLEEQFANYDTVLQIAADAGVPVWVSTTQPRGQFTPPLRDLQRAVADTTLARYGRRALDFWYCLAAQDGSILPQYDAGDGVHLNDGGHAVLYRQVVDSGIWLQIIESATDPVDRAPVLPAAIQLYPNAPNPFNPSTRIGFDLTRDEPVTLVVFDARGRRVRRLIAASLPPGHHDAIWDGCDDTGRAVASGVYVCRLETPERIMTQAMTLMK